MISLNFGIAWIFKNKLLFRIFLSLLINKQCMICDMEEVDVLIIHNQRNMRVLCNFLLLQLVLTEAAINQKCITPHGDIGTCMEITSCPLYQRYKERLTNRSVKKYLRQSYCGERFKMKLICCGPEGRSIVDECGVMDSTSNKIFGGEIVKEHFPWMAAILYKENDTTVFKCQGFLINPRFIVTAAHCLKYQAVYAVVLGLSNLTNYQEQENFKKIHVMNISVHEDYIKYIDDIGLIKIQPVAYTDTIRWICLPKQTTPTPEWYTIRGWGKNDRMQRAFTVALEGRIRSASYMDCPQASRKNVSWNRVICAGGEPNKDSCKGDSGGALMNETADLDWTAFGIVAYGSGDCSRGDPGVYTRIQYYLGWLEHEMLRMLES